MLTLDRAIELVAKLSRTKKYPADDDGIEFLARGLQYAADTTNIGAGRIVDRCAQTSEWCPTDADLLTVGRDLAREDAVAAGTYNSLANAGNLAVPRAEMEKLYGPPVQIDVAAEFAAAVEARGNAAQKRRDEMWRAIRKRLRLRPNDDYPSWAECAAAARVLAQQEREKLVKAGLSPEGATDVVRELGYLDHAKAWERSQQL